MNPTADILVAIDGSPESTAALTWASHEAQVSARGLRLVHVVEYLPGYGYVWASTVGAATALQDAGEPVVTSNVSSLPEVVGDAALLIEPLDAGAIASAMARVLSEPDLRADLIRRGHERAKLFSWDRTVTRIRAIYAELGAQGHD